MERRGTLVYVHGARDRGAEVDDHVARIERGLRLAALPFDVLPARWGEEAGASLEHIERVLPLLGARPTGTQSSEQLAMPRDDGMLRALLHEGPLAELEQLARGTPAGTRDAQRREADQLLEICRTEIGSPGELITLAGGETASLAQACRVASATVEASPAYTTAHAAPVAESELIAAAGRAVAASVAAHAAQPLDVLQTVQLRIAEAVLGAAGATLLAGYLGIDVGAGLKRWATDVLLPHRARLMRDAAVGPADVLLYQHDGARMRGVVARALGQARSRGGPVLALGNSLGGIILVGLLAEPTAPRPDLLVTVGSQAPLLSLIGALEPLDGDGSRSPFAPWLNVYDRRDLLGFVAGGVWPDQPGITDREVDLGVGFPDAHGATYLSHADVYRHIREHPVLNGASGGGGQPAQRFPIRLGPRSRPLLRLLFGVKEENAYVELNGGLDARFGWFNLRTPLSNVESWSIEGPWRWLTAIGVRRGLLAGDVTFGGNHKGGVRLNFREPVRWAIFRAPALYVSVADMEGLAAALSARGIPGEGKRTG